MSSLSTSTLHQMEVCGVIQLLSNPAGPQRVPSLLKHAEEPGAKLPALHHRQTPETLPEGPAAPQQVWSVENLFTSLYQNTSVLSYSCRAPSTGDGRFPEALQLVKEQKLFAEALRLYASDGPHYKVTQQKI